ncbi:MAG TPA: phosphomannomutase/phosphoglucomutase [Patescibacteria group bacterium]|nr:phosphomannomutase/phosphoglucomutase [Patescibacteria group bacterium]
MNIETSIFKAYDIRGFYPSQLNEAGAEAIARAFATLLKSELPEGKVPRVGISRDMRLSSPALRDAVVKGLTKSGFDVVDFGMQATPIFYFGVGYLSLDGGIQISASHNGPEWNGLKLVRASSVPVSGDTGIMQIKNIVLTDAYITSGRVGIVEHYKDLDKVNVQEHLQLAGVEVKDGTVYFARGKKSMKKLTIAIDPANAMGISEFGEFFAQLPNVELVKINWEYDGTFPAHESDPMVAKNLEPTQKLVVESGADFGMVPDGDADRLFFIDEKGEVVPPEFIRGLLAQFVLREHPGARVAYDIRPGRITRDMIEEMGGYSEVTRVGHSLIKEQMIKNNIEFGGESSAHFFYRTPQGTFECQMIAVLRVMQYLSENNKPFSQLIAPYKRYFNSGELNTKVANREVVAERLVEIKQKYAGGALNEIDGIFIEFPDVWFSVRASNTEPVLRLIVEARSKAVMDKYVEEILGIIRVNKPPKA